MAFAARNQSVTIIRESYKPQDVPLFMYPYMKEVAGLDLKRYRAEWGGQPWEFFSWMRAHFLAAAGVIGTAGGGIGRSESGGAGGRKLEESSTR